MRAILLSALVLGLLASAADAQLIVGNDQTGVATIYDVNPTTGVATPLYSSSTSDAKPWGMAYDAANNLLYWNSGGQLYRSPLGPALVPQLMGNLTFNGAATNYVALSFSNGSLFGTRNITTEAVYRIDLNTLDAAIVYQYASTFDFGGLEHDSTTGKLYGLTDTPSTGRGLYEFDLGAMTETFRAPYPAGQTDIDGLAVHNGIAYYVTDGPNAGTGAQPFFYVFDVNTGAELGTLPSPFTGSGTFSAATWVPEPASLGAIAIAAVLAMRRRRQ